MDIRECQREDRVTLLGLAVRLTIGVAPWREPGAVAAAVRGWVEGSIDGAADGHGAVFVAIDEGEIVGFVSVGERHHFAGALDAYIGELVTAENAEGRGVARALLDRAEQWARDRSYERITLDTGAGNERALAVYDHLGWQREDVRLSKPLS